MKINSLLPAFLLAATTIAFTACKQGQAAGTSSETKNTSVTQKSNGNNLISFKVNGQQVTTSGWTISRFAWSSNPADQWLNITSNMHDEKRTINVNLAGASPGHYALGNDATTKGHSHGSYYPDYMENLSNSYSFSSGSFHITEVDTLKRLVSGTFTGTVKNLKGETLEITDGKIENGVLNTGVIVY